MVEIEETNGVGEMASAVESNVFFVGRTFISPEEAETCYRKYGVDNGFSIKRRSSDKTTSHSDEVTVVRFACICHGVSRTKKKSSENGKGVKRNTKTIRTGCVARMRIKWASAIKMWTVTVFEDVHNHSMITPTKRILMKSRRHLPKAAKALTEIFCDQGIQINKVREIFGGSANCTFDDIALYNHLRKKRAEINNNGDAQAMREYFEQARVKDKEFYYAIDVDNEGRAANFFWVNGASRRAYRQFGEAVTFDTTYNTNKYKMPFGPFTGVNHHRQSILFGCALLENEQEETFKWVFYHWLHAMEEKQPISFITDQDGAIGNAVADVFPNSKHRLCLWHIKKKFPSYFSQLYFKKSDFKKQLKRCIHLTYRIEDFENQWAALVIKYNLQDHKWMKDMYALRHKWIPVYCRNTLCAGMQTTQRSESMNSLFDAFVSPNTSLIEFVHKYDKALEAISVRERKEDFNSIYKHYTFLEHKIPLVVHAASVYTNNMFEKFNQEFNEGYKHRACEKDFDGVIQTYDVRYNWKNTKDFVVADFLVKMNMVTYEGSCECQKFEFEGIPCRHLCHIFYRLYLTEIPSHFILERWTKFANRIKLDSQPNLTIHNELGGEVAAFACDLYKDFGQTISLVRSRELYDLCKQLSKEMFQKVCEADRILLQKENCETPIVEPVVNRAEVLLLDPHFSQTKGRKRENQSTVSDDGGASEMYVDPKIVPVGTNNARIKSSLEKAVHKKKRVCRTCKGVDVNHDTRNCPQNPKLISKVVL